MSHIGLHCVPHQRTVEHMFFLPASAHELEAKRLEGEIAELCGLLNATTARLVGKIAEVLTTESWTGSGIRSAEHWVAWQCGVSTGRARRLVAMARRLGELPEAEAAFGAGELSEDQVVVIARHTPVHNDGEVTGFARDATVSQLQRTLRTYPVAEPARAEAEAASEPEPVPSEECREVSFGHTDSGRWRLSADLPADEGALVERSLSAQRDRLFRTVEDGEQVTWADALLAMAERAGVSESASRTHRDRSLILIHLEAPLDGPDGPDGPGGQPGAPGQPIAHLHNGPALPDTLRRYLSCDSRVRPLWKTDGVAVSVGRALRTVPERTRIVVEERDRGCRTPGCSRTRWLHVHHVVHWEDGGTTDTPNLVCLCALHHRLHHRGLLGICGNADQPGELVFTDVRGRVLRANAPPVAPHGALRSAARLLDIEPSTYCHPTGERLDPWCVGFSEPLEPAPPEPD